MPVNVVNRYGFVKQITTDGEKSCGRAVTEPHSELLQQPPMDTNDEVRRRRLEQLARAVGGLEAIGAASGTSAAYLTHVIKKRLGSKKKADGTKTPVALGDAAARQIEAAFGLSAGWLDWPFQTVPFTAWAKLEAVDRAFVEGAMLSAIERRTGELKQEVIHARPATQIQGLTGFVPAVQQTGKRRLARADHLGYVGASTGKESTHKRHVALEDAAGYADNKNVSTRNQRAKPQKGRGGA